MGNENYGSRIEHLHTEGEIASYEDLRNMGLSSDWDGENYNHAKVRFNRDHGIWEAKIIETSYLDATSTNDHRRVGNRANFSQTLRNLEDVRAITNYLHPGLGDLLVPSEDGSLAQ